MIEIKGLTKAFGDLPVLQGINLNIPQGTIYGLVGRSGAGKSTLLRCINGLETYDEGSLRVDGVEVKSLSGKDIREFRKNIGMIFQQFSLLTRLSVYENIALPLRCWKYSSSYIDHKVKELLELIDIPDKINAMPKELSGGQKQRVAIARALTMNPKLLLCDEATSALDPKTAKSITTLLNQINHDLGITIVVVTHQMSVLRSTCEEIAILESGKLAVNGPVEQMFLQQPEALKNLIGEKDLLLLSEGINIKILLSHETSSKPVITKMARELSIDFMILGGEMESYKNSTLGSLIINIPNEHFHTVKKYFADNNVAWEFIENNNQALTEVEE
ncbi:methionine ABC transporter ATP-binding protein [Sporomusa malonica]|uniref:D-methionine transport system ATP-binding protein n=1 Tax=Sporomusa malonica TaxID=112901 RepID=A0A1W2DPS0_9FIRM|nr:methionine ABC transporter ATP-binding protein [Sporomusa malonica]SMC99424.1 D-methionine transport system ATP-binding protein [Sporomusa malonica]